VSPTKKIAAVVVLAAALVLGVAPIASAHQGYLSASLGCNGTVTWTVSSNANPGTFTVSDASGTQATGAVSSGNGYSVSGSFSIPTSIGSDTISASIAWSDGYTKGQPGDVVVTRPTDCQATPAIATHASGPATVGGAINDVATLSGAVAATGAVTFQVFAPGDTSCSTPLATLAAQSKNVDANGNGAYTSATYTASTPGAYLWRAFFGGDANNNAVAGPCGADGESSTANQASPAIATQASGPVTVGGAINDVATLSGAVAATGAVTFQVFGPGDTSCSTPLATLAAQSKNVDANGNGTYTSASFATSNTGTYRWRAFFAGDARNNAAAGPCGADGESSTANQASPAIATQAAGPVTVGGAINDVATLSGAVAATGAVTFQVFGPGDTSCSTPLATLAAQSKNVDANGNGTYTSASFATSSAGTYRWRAFFAGDATNSAASGACNAANESSTANPPSTPPSTPSNPAISITKNPKSQSIGNGATANFTITVTNTGNVTLTNVTVSDALTPGCDASSSTIQALASMAPGATVTYNCSLANVTASFTNSATASGTPPSGPNVSATDVAPVTVAPLTPPPSTPATPKPKPKPTHPAIAIVKDPASQTVAVGGTATFTITVTNTGDVALSDVTVTDPLSADCGRSLGTLDAGQSKTYTCTRSDVTAGFVNVAAASGKPPAGPAVEASDHATVTAKPFVPPARPAIRIVKSPKSQALTTKVTDTTTASGATKTAVHYGTAVFTIAVTNDGNVALHGVAVHDPSSPGCDHLVGSLAPGASREYSCTRAAVAAGYTNVATADGISPTGTKVTASDHADVTVKVKTTSTSAPKFTG
jgi:uncharacterized repeat protein (TIGR01451 family)